MIPPVEADKELSEILVKAKFVKISGENLEYITTLEEDKTALLAWRDKAVVAELEELLHDLPLDVHVRRWVKPRLSKLKAIMEIKE